MLMPEPESEQPNQGTEPTLDPQVSHTKPENYPRQTHHQGQSNRHFDPTRDRAHLSSAPSPQLPHQGAQSIHDW